MPVTPDLPCGCGALGVPTASESKCKAVSHDAAAQEEDADVWDANDGLDAAVMLVAVVVLLVVVVVVAWP